jgi:hypothetical protein
MTTRKKWTATGSQRRALDQRIYLLVGRRATEVRITRVNWPGGARWVTTVFGLGGREVPLYARGLHLQAALVLKDVFPDADWSTAQDYDVKTGVLRQHVAPAPAGLREDKL